MFYCNNWNGNICFNVATVEELEDTKGVIRICTSKKNRQHNGQKKKYKRTNNDLQNASHKYDRCIYHHKYDRCKYHHKYDRSIYQHKYDTCVYQHICDRCIYHHKYGSCIYHHKYDKCLFHYKYDRCIYHHI